MISLALTNPSPAVRIPPVPIHHLPIHHLPASTRTAIRSSATRRLSRAILCLLATALPAVADNPPETAPSTPQPAVEARQSPPKAPNPWTAAQGFYPEFPDAWMNFHRSLKEQAAKGNVDLLFIGDSLTMGWDKELWEKHYAPHRAANFGVGGDGTPQLLWRLENGGFDGLAPRTIVLMIGINNVWPGFSAEDTARGIRTFVGKLREKMPSATILLMGVLPAFDETDTIRNYAATVNTGISGLDDGKNIRFIDFGKDLLQPDGKRKPGYYLDDRLHLLKPAYEAWAKALAPFLETTKPR